MSLSTRILSNIRTSRLLTDEDADEFEGIQRVTLKNFTIDGNGRVYYSEGEFEDENPWSIVGSFKLVVESSSKYHFYIESLMYLIEHFFEPRNIKLSGTIIGIDELFASYHAYNVVDNQIFHLPETVEYLENLNLSSNIFENFSLVMKYLETIITN
jgi:hypothetical protein